MITKADNLKNRYSLFSILQLCIWIIRTKIIEKKARIEYPSTTTGVVRHSNVKVTNKSENVIRVIVESPAPFVCQVTDFTIDPKSYVLCPIDFAPKEAGKYKGVATIKSESGTLTKISLTGICFELRHTIQLHYIMRIVFYFLLLY